MWTPTTRRRHSRDGLRYETDLTDAEWAVIEPLMPEIVRKPPDQIGFAVHPRRWVVERFFGWISRNRRLWNDPEATLTSARAFLYAPSVMPLARRLARTR